MEEDKEKNGCFVYGVLGGIVLIGWFISGAISKGGIEGGFEEISTEIFGWIIFGVIALIIYGIYDFMKR
ncbi:hypothetical protein [Algibacter sp. L4_22]|uniref:hypothetical protein n=1 Tax=Algibacter sp. L4_22 TaxID=2942477 RepID=UPI00201B61BE|nr:hypothetical protein [Algibacter sp. L4_22]MCL5127122.1 hypothetical protein [Algibacter sp. L4_22]